MTAKLVNKLQSVKYFAIKASKSQNTLLPFSFYLSPNAIKNHMLKFYFFWWLIIRFSS